MVNSAGLYVVILERRERSTTQSAARNGFPNSICVPDPIGTMAPFSSVIAAARSATDSGRTVRPTDCPSMSNAGTSQQHGFDAFADLHRVRCRGTANLGTGVARWENFGRIEPASGVENTLHVAHHVHIRVAEDEPHELLLFDADSMF